MTIDPRQTPQDSSEFCRQFWNYLNERHPGQGPRVKDYAAYSVWLNIEGLTLAVGLGIAAGHASIFLRGASSYEVEDAYALVLPHRPVLEVRLGVPIGEVRTRQLFLKKASVEASNRRTWDWIADWHVDQAGLYRAVLRETVGKYA